MSVEVLTTGLHSLLVDSGRPCARALGLPLGGAADPNALALGNALLGNPSDALALEITMLGPTLRFTQAVPAVLFGAPFRMTSTAKAPRQAGTTFTTEPGEELRIGGTTEGLRGYLCVGGGFQADRILGSRSAFAPIPVGQMLHCQSGVIAARRLPFLNLVRRSDAETILRVVSGPQRDWFTDAFFQQSYRVSPSSNRMGLRLLGQPIERRPGELTSEAVAPGAVQITNDGLPIILGVDGQTIGGYPKVAHVLAVDLGQLGQLRPGTSVRFQLVTPDEAETAYREQSASLHNWLTRLRASHS